MTADNSSESGSKSSQETPEWSASVLISCFYSMWILFFGFLLNTVKITSSSVLFHCLLHVKFNSFFSPSLAVPVLACVCVTCMDILTHWNVFFTWDAFLNAEWNVYDTMTSHLLPRSCSGTVISVLEKLLSQATEQDHPGRLVIEAAHGRAVKVRELLQKYPDKVSRSTVRTSRLLSDGLRELKQGKNLFSYLLPFFRFLSDGEESLVVQSYFWHSLSRGL